MAQIATQFALLNIELDPYIAFVQSLPYRFYPIYMLSLLPLLAIFSRDFGPMLHYQRAALESPEDAAELPAVDSSTFEHPMLVPKPDQPRRLRNLILPLGVTIAAILAGLFALIAGMVYSGIVGVQAAGGNLTFESVLGATDAISALLWAVLTGCIFTVVLLAVQCLLTPAEALDVWTIGVQSVVVILLTLLSAWALSITAASLRTASYLVQLLSSSFPISLLPTLIFLLAALVSFATGSSWGTMALLFPLAIPVAVALSSETSYLLNCLSGVLAGSIVGDHASPLSDTTITASLACSIPVDQHVRTQLPYVFHRLSSGSPCKRMVHHLRYPPNWPGSIALDCPARRHSTPCCHSLVVSALCL